MVKILKNLFSNKTYLITGSTDILEAIFQMS